MYSRFVKGCRNACIYHSDDVRGEKIRILEMLSDTKLFRDEKAVNSDDYIILNDLLIKIQALDISVNGYHRFAHFISVLGFLGFSAEGTYSGIDDDTVDFLLALMKSILNFEYDELSDSA